MKKEDKELLFQELCARLPYGVKCKVQEDEYTYIGTLCRIEVDNKNGHLLDFVESISGSDCQVNLSEVRPYLFPLSSMTEEQEKELLELGRSLQFWDLINEISDLDCVELIDWLIKNNFDYRGLIPKGLAIDATGKGIY